MKSIEQLAEERLDTMIAQLQREPLYPPMSPEWEAQCTRSERLQLAAYRELVYFVPAHIAAKLHKIVSHAAYLTLHDDDFKLKEQGEL